MNLRGKQRVGAALLAGALVVLAALVWWRFGRASEHVTVAVQPGEVVMQVSGPGSVQAQSTVQLAARLGSSVQGVLVDVGDRVSAGQLLVELDDREPRARLAALRARQRALDEAIVAARAALARAEAELELARSLQQRDVELASKGYVAQSALDVRNAGLKVASTGVDAARASLDSREAEAASFAEEVAAAEVTLSYSRLLSPIDGVVTRRLAEPGDTVGAGSIILTLVDPATLWVATRVDESVVGRIALQQPARIRLRSGAQLDGQVARIARQSDAATRELDVFVRFATTQESFAIDQEAQVDIDTGRVTGLVVPIAALTRDTAGRLGVLLVESGRTRFQAVLSDAMDGDKARIVEGLHAGQIVIADAKGVRANQSVRSADAS